MPADPKQPKRRKLRECWVWFSRTGVPWFADINRSRKYGNGRWVRMREVRRGR